MDETGRDKSTLIGMMDDLKEKFAVLRALNNRSVAKTQQGDVIEARQRFADALEYELRTAVTPIRLAVGMFLDGMLGEITESQRNYLEIVRRNVDRLVHFVDEVIAYANFESEEVYLEPKRISVLAVIRDANEIIRKKAEEKNINIDIGNQTELFVHADYQALLTVITNLLENAVFHNPSNTQVRINTQLIEKDMVRIEVIDSGKGIPADKIGRLFDNFLTPAQLSDTRTGGVGIGLNVCAKLVEKMGGQISVESNLGKGSLFYFTVPVSRNSITAKPKSPL